MRRNSRHIRSGFTLVEMLAVVVIIGILAAVIIPKFGIRRGEERPTQPDDDAGVVLLRLSTLYHGPGFTQIRSLPWCRAHGWRGDQLRLVRDRVPPRLLATHVRHLLRQRGTSRSSDNGGHGSLQLAAQGLRET